MKSSLVPAFQFVFSASFNSNDVYSCEYRHEKVEQELTMAEILQIAQPRLSEYIGPGGRWTGCRGVSAALHIGDTAFKVDRALFLFG